MARLLSTLLVLALLGGTAAAFAVTEGLKLEKSPVFRTRVDKVFSPVCHCSTRVAHVGFSTRKIDRLTLVVVDAQGRVVRTLVHGRRLNRGFHHFTWNGRTDSGTVAAEGSYKPRVHLAKAHRTIVLPNPIQIDVTPPRVHLLSVAPQVFSPDRDGRREVVAVRYRLSEPAHVLLLVDGVQQVVKRGQQVTGEVQWFGKQSGRPLPAGTYRLSLEAVDLAGNRSARTPARTVVIRYISLARTVVRARAGTRFGLGVRTDARGYSWRLNGRTGQSRGHLLVLRAPARPGRYRLYVQVHGRAASAVIVVRAKP